MNPVIFAKSAKGLILASGLVAISTVVGYAQDGTLTLGPAAQMPLTNAYQTPPTGMVTLGGHLFDMTSGTAVTAQDRQSASFSGSFKNATSAYVLVNTYDSYWWYKGAVAGRVTLSFSDGTSQSTDLVVGANVREWIMAGSYVIATTTDPASTNVWTGSAQPAGSGKSAVIDMLTIPVTGAGKTLTGVTLTSAAETNATAPLGVLLSAVTIDYKPFTRPGNSGNTPALENSQAQEHSNSANFTGQSPANGKSAASAGAGMATPAVAPRTSDPTSDSDKHTNRGHR